MNEEWLGNVDKRIAFLTKTVFRLHAESVDRKDDVAKLAQKLNDELDESKKASENALREVEKGLTTYRQNIDATIRQSYESEFSSVRKQFDNVRTQIESDSNSLIKTTSDIMMQIRQEFSELKALADIKLKEFSDTQMELQKLHDSVVIKVKEKNKRVLADTVTNANQQYNKVLMDTAKKEEELRAKNEEELNELRRSLASGQQKKLAEIMERQRDLENQHRKLEQEREDIQITVNQMKLYIIDNQNDIQEKINKFSEQKTNVTSEYCEVMASQKSALHNLQVQHEEELEKLRGLFDIDEKNYQDQLKQIENELEIEKSALEAKLAELEASQSDSAQEASQRRNKIISDHEQTVNELNEKYKTFMAKAAQREQDMQTELEKLISEHDIQIQKQKTDIFSETQKYESEFAELKKKNSEELEKMKADFIAEIKKKKEELETYQNSAQSSAQEVLQQIESIKQEIEKIKNDNEAEKGQKEKEYQQAMDAIKQEQGQWKENQQTEFKNEIDTLKSEHKQKIKEIHDIHQKKVQDFTESALAKRKADGEALQKELLEKQENEMQAIKEEKEKKLAEIDAQIDDRQRAKDNAEKYVNDEINKRQTKVSEIKREIQEIDTNWKNEKARLQSEFASKIASLKADHAEKEKRKKEMAEMKESEFKEEMNRLKAELTEITQRTTDENTDHQTFINNSKRSHVIQVKALKEEIEMLLSQREKLVADLNSQIEQFKNSSAEQRNNMTEQSSKTIGDLTKQLEKAKSEHETELRIINKEIDEKEKSHKEKLAALRVRNVQHDTELGMELNKIKEQDDKDLGKLKDVQNTEITNMSLQFMQLKQEYEKQRQQNMNSIQEQENEFNTYFAQKTQELNEEKRQIDEEIQMVERQKKEEINRIQAEIREWEDKFDNRGPRQIDLDLIDKLQSQLQERTEQLNKVKEGLKKTQAELMNMAKTLGKVFSSNPHSEDYTKLEHRFKHDALLASTTTTGSSPHLPPLTRSNGSSNTPRS